DMIRIAPPGSKAGSPLLSGIVEQPAHLLGVQAHRATCGCTRAKSSHQYVSVFENGPLHSNCLKSAHPNVVTERDSPREVLSTDPDFFADRQCGWNNRAAGMLSSACVVIVGFIGVSEFPVSNGRFNRPQE